jgi:hypothetical protein
MRSNEHLADLMSIRQACEAIGENPTPTNLQRMRRRMELLDESSGGKVLRTLNGRRTRGANLWISKTGLMFELRTDYARHDSELSALRCQLEGVENRLTGLGRAHRRLDKRVLSFEKRQARINQLHHEIFQKLRELTYIGAK